MMTGYGIHKLFGCKVIAAVALAVTFAYVVAQLFVVYKRINITGKGFGLIALRAGVARCRGFVRFKGVTVWVHFYWSLVVSHWVIKFDCHFEHSEKSIHCKVYTRLMYRFLPLVEMTIARVSVRSFCLASWTDGRFLALWYHSLLAGSFN
jgi:hypothetical protein